MNKPFLFLLIQALLSLNAHASVIIVNGFLVIDNSDSVPGNFSTTGGWGTDYGDYVDQDLSWGNSRMWSNGGNGATDSWNWGTGTDNNTTLTSGVYEIWVSWKSGSQDNLYTGTYSRSDSFSSVLVDQRPGVASYNEELTTITLSDGGHGAQFVRIGAATVSDGTFTLTLTDTPDSFHVFADAVAITAIPEPSTYALAIGFLALVLVSKRRSSSKQLFQDQ